jgi:hypothetical protein
VREREISTSGFEGMMLRSVTMWTTMFAIPEMMAGRVYFHYGVATRFFLSRRKVVSCVVEGVLGVFIVRKWQLVAEWDRVAMV